MSRLEDVLKKKKSGEISNTRAISSASASPRPLPSKSPYVLSAAERSASAPAAPTTNAPRITVREEAKKPAPIMQPAQNAENRVQRRGSGVSLRTMGEVNYDLAGIKRRRGELATAVEAGDPAAAEEIFSLNKRESELNDEANEIAARLARTSGMRPATLADIIANSAQRGYYGAKKGNALFSEMNGGTPEEGKTSADYNAILEGEKYNFVPQGTLARGVSGALELLGQQAAQITSPETLGGIAGTGLAAAVAGAGTEAALAGTLATGPAAPAILAAGIPIAIAAGSAINNMKIEAGNAYEELLQNGVSEDTARGIALAVGGVNGALEALQLDEVIKGFHLLRASGVAKEGTQTLGRFIVDRLASLGNEVAQEVAQESVTIAGTQIGTKAETGDWAYKADEVLDRLGETAGSSALAFGLAGLPGNLSGSWNIARQNLAAKNAPISATDVYGELIAVGADEQTAQELAPILANAINEEETPIAPAKTPAQVEEAPQTAETPLASPAESVLPVEAGTDTPAQENAAEEARKAETAALAEKAKMIEDFADTMGKAGADALIENYDPAQDAGAYIKNMARAYNAGREGVSLDFSRLNREQRAPFTLIGTTEDQVLAAWRAGQRDAEAAFVEEAKTEKADAVKQDNATIWNADNARIVTTNGRAPDSYKYEVVSVQSDGSVTHVFYDNKAKAAAAAKNGNGLLGAGTHAVVDLRQDGALAQAVEAVTSAKENALAESRARLGFASEEELQAARQASAENMRQFEESMQTEGANENGGENADGARGAGNVSQRAGERTERVSGGAEAAGGERRTEARDRGDREALLRNAERHEVKAKSLFREAKDQNVRVYDGSPTEDVRKARALAEKNGLKITVFEGEIELEKGIDPDRADTVRGFFNPNTGEIGVQGNNREHTSYELAQHEVTEKMIAKGELDAEAVVLLAGKNIDKSEIDAVIDVYEQSNPREGRASAMKELVCDAGDHINQLRYDVDNGLLPGEYFRELADLFDRVLDVLHPIVVQETRGAVEMDEAKRGTAAEAEGSTVAQNGEIITAQEQKSLDAVGVQYDSDSDVFTSFSAKTVPATPEQREAAIQAMMRVCEKPREQIAKYIDDQMSIANIIMKQPFLMDYERHGDLWLRKNSDYPGGSIDLSNNCPKRKALTDLSTMLQRNNPNRLFTAEDVTVMRDILAENGRQIDCGPCFNEDRRQRLGEIADEFIEGVKGNEPLKPKIAEMLPRNDKYVPTQYDLITEEGLRKLRGTHPEIASAFEAFNNSRGMQAGRLIDGYAEYSGQILQWPKSRINNINKKYQGLRIFSSSDAEIPIFMDIMQIVTDASARGLMIQGYSKQNTFLYLVKDTNMNVLRSHIAAGKGWKWENGRKALVYDPVEGIDFNDPLYKLIPADSKNIGNNVIGISDEHIRLAMEDPFLDQILPFHTNVKSETLERKHIGHWKNYKTEQREHGIRDGVVSGDYDINIYTDVIDAARDYGRPIRNREDFVTKFLQVAKEKQVDPRFSRFLNKSGDEYVYTPGYEKFLVDFRMFDRNGNYIEPKPVEPNFDPEYITEMLHEYAEGKRGGKQIDATVYNQVAEALDLPKVENGTEFSRKLSDIEELARKNAELRQRVEYWRGQTKKTEGIRPLKQDEVRKTARGLIEDYATVFDREETNAFVEKLGELYDKMLRGDVANEEMNERARELAADLVENARTLKENAEDYRDIKSRLRDTVIVVPDSMAKEAITDFKDYREKHMGRVTIAYESNVKNAPPPKADRSGRVKHRTSLDTFYNDLAESYPYYFKPDLYAEDQLMRIFEVDSMLDDIYENPHDQYKEYAIADAMNDLLDRFFDVPQVRPTFADRAEKALTLAKIDKANALKKVRENRDERTAALKAHYAEVAQEKRERAADSAARTRLLKIVKRLKNKKLSAVNRALLNSYIGDIDTVAKSMTGKTLEKLSELRDWYEDRKTNDKDFLTDEHIEKVLARLSKRQIGSLTADEVSDLANTLLFFEAAIRNERKMIDEQDRRDVYLQAEEAINNIRDSKGSRGGFWDEIVTELLSPARQVRRYTGYVESDPLYRATASLEDGQRKMFDYQRRANEKFRKWTEDNKFTKRLAGKNAEEITIGGYDADGKLVEVKITPSMRMALYLHSLNDQNLRHIAGGGIRVPDMKRYKKGKIAEAYARGTVIRMTPSMVRGLAESMTAEERAFANAAHAYFNGMSREEINATSEKLLGYSLADVENYFPINTDSRFTKADFENIKNDGSIEGMGFLKERVNASNPILLRDMNEVLEQAIRMHAKYVGLAIPVRNINKLWKVSLGGTLENGTRVRFADSVPNALENKYGSRAAPYITKLLGDLQNPPKKQDDFGRRLAAVRSNYAAAVLTLNAGTALKQLPSYFTSAAVLGWKPLLRALGDFRKVNLDEVSKYTPLLWRRAQGFNTQELGEIAQRGKTLPKALNWIQGADILATSKLWTAAEYYVREHRPDLTVGSEAFRQEQANIYNRAIEETQPNYTTMQRPQLLRSENELVKTLNMFKTQLFQNFNVLYDAYGNLDAKRRAWTNTGTEEAKQAYKEAKQGAARATSALVVSTFGIALANFLWNAVIRGKKKKYEDKDGEETAASVVKGMGLDMLSSTFAMLPFGKEALEAGEAFTDGVLKALDRDPYFEQKWYGLDVSVVETANNTVNSAMKTIAKTAELVQKALDDEKSVSEADWETYARALYSSAKDLSKLGGAPVENVGNLFSAVAQKTLTAANGKYVGGYQALRITTDPSSNKGDYYDLLYKAYKNDPEAYKEVYAMMIDSGRFDTEKKSAAENIKNAMEDRMKKEQGVGSVDDLSERYLPPSAKKSYDKELSAISRSNVWRQANSTKRDYVEDMLYDLVSGSQSAGAKSAREKIEGGKSVGITETDYLLYRLALSMADKPNEHGDLGTYIGDEVEEAIRMVPGLSDDERDYLWIAQGRSEKTIPNW